MLDIEIFPTVDLIKELARRCSPCVFIGTRYEGDSHEREWKNFNFRQGNLDTCRGLCHEMDSLLQREMIKQELNERETGEED